MKFKNNDTGTIRPNRTIGSKLIGKKFTITSFRNRLGTWPTVPCSRLTGFYKFPSLHSSMKKTQIYWLFHSQKVVWSKLLTQSQKKHISHEPLQGRFKEVKIGTTPSFMDHCVVTCRHSNNLTFSNSFHFLQWTKLRHPVAPSSRDNCTQKSREASLVP